MSVSVLLILMIVDVSRTCVLALCILAQISTFINSQPQNFCILKALDKYEIMELFRSIGMTLTTETLDNLFKLLDSDGDGTIDLEEFQAMLDGEMEPSGNAKRGGMSWIQKAIIGHQSQRHVMGSQQGTKLDAAHRMADVEKVVDHANIFDEDVDDAELHIEDQHYESENEYAKQMLSFSIYLKDKDDPLVMTCSKPVSKIGFCVTIFIPCILHNG